ncbi:MAG TPA: CYTH domain-containing protein [Candidatus Paceibacterota bacterium]
MSHLYEVEIKSLLGSKEKADNLISKLKKHDKNIKLSSQGRQLNHYFNVPEKINLKKVLLGLIPKDKKTSFDKIMKDGKKLSVRTRDADGKVLIVLKASVGDDSSSNGVKRIEFESPVNISLDNLDKILLSAGLSYQAKWSRERKEYASKDLHVCIDKNAGYGFLAEFEKVTPIEDDLDKIKKDLLSLMKKMGVEELSQDRLERMFAHYNSNWKDYYGTEKTFNIE